MPKYAIPLAYCFQNYDYSQQEYSNVTGMKNEKKSHSTSSSVPVKGFKKIDVEGDIFKQIFKYSVIPTVVHDMEMNILNANDSAVKMFGYSMDELLEISVFDLHTDEELENSARVLKTMKKEKKLSVETSFKRKDGSIFFAEATPCKYMLEGKPLIHVFIQDITDRKKAEKKLHDSAEALQVEVNKVKEYSKQIESKNKELEEFSYVAAHDLKAPITNLSILSEMISAEQIPEEQRSELFSKLKKNINQMYKKVFTLNDVINFKTTLVYETEKLSFEETFNEIKESITEQLENSKAIIEEDFSACPEINYPALHLKSIIQNLLTNAIKYRDPDKALKIQVKTTLDDGLICLKIKDNGLGFEAKKYKEKIFGLFKRMHTHVEGMGVGMYIVKSILDSHGGKIEVKSEPGKGALFNVYFKNEKL